MLGGEKYLACGILFKFSVDWRGLFGSDYAAAKVAGHELKGLVRPALGLKLTILYFLF